VLRVRGKVRLWEIKREEMGFKKGLCRFLRVVRTGQKSSPEVAEGDRRTGVWWKKTTEKGPEEHEKVIMPPGEWVKSPENEQFIGSCLGDLTICFLLRKF